MIYIRLNRYLHGKESYAFFFRRKMGKKTQYEYFQKVIKSICGLFYAPGRSQNFTAPTACVKDYLTETYLSDKNSGLTHLNLFS